MENGLENYYATVDHKKLRYGFTTGSCAAAASCASCRMLFTYEDVTDVFLDTPEGIRLHLPVEEITRTKGPDGSVRKVRCAVRKDAGDDVDATDGLLIFSEVSRTTEPGIRIDGGEGVGRVCSAGLDQPVGEAAINHVPREMIRREIEQVTEENAYHGGIRVVISVPGGEKIAEKTLNGSLGIEGGISILGTTGIVHPMSRRALVDSIRVAMKSLIARGHSYITVTPGNYGESFARRHADINCAGLLKCSNYFGETIDMAEELGAKGLLFVAHIGKLIKVSGGIMNTHSREADARRELLCASVIRCKGSAELGRAMLSCTTTEEALTILDGADRKLFGMVVQDIADRAQAAIRHRCAGTMMTGVMMFSNRFGLLAETEHAEKLRQMSAAEGDR